MFMPGVPQIWYLDIFAGKNNYEAADKGGSGGHKEINRTTLTLQDIENGLKRDVVAKQIELIRLRNISKAFLGSVKIDEISDIEIDIKWVNKNEFAHLKANLKTHTFNIDYTIDGLAKTMAY